MNNKIILLLLTISVLMSTAYGETIVKTSCPSLQNVYDLLKKNGEKTDYSSRGQFLWTTDQKVPYEVSYNAYTRPYDVKLDSLLSKNSVSFFYAQIHRGPSSDVRYSALRCEYELANIVIYIEINTKFHVDPILNGGWLLPGNNWSKNDACGGNGSYSSYQDPKDCTFSVKID